MGDDGIYMVGIGIVIVYEQVGLVFIMWCLLEGGGVGFEQDCFFVGGVVDVEIVCDMVSVDEYFFVYFDCWLFIGG